MKTKPFISIVLPTRDRPLLVGEVLKFIMKQTFTDYEVIVSDNGINASCYEQVAPYLQDKRFSYKKPQHPMDMCSHWDFAIEGVTGEYVTIFSEKFILRYDALQCLFDLAKTHSPDVITWQFDLFDITELTPNQVLGSYHPLVKPAVPVQYSAKIELEKRFAFDFPVFARHNKSSDSYGKIYSGCVKKQLLNKIKRDYGRVFHPVNPDFTSMFAILNESEKCFDVAQSLMLVLNMDGISNGEATKKSILATKRFLSDFDLDLEQYFKALPLRGFWLGHNVHCAADILRIQNLAQGGPIKELSIDLTALAFWAQEDLHKVTEWGDVEPSEMQTKLDQYFAEMSEMKLTFLRKNIEVAQQPNPAEIYHSGLIKLTEFNPDTSAKELAEVHWLKGMAPPRKNIGYNPVTLEDAAQYFYEYNLSSCELLNINLEVTK